MLAFTLDGFEEPKLKEDEGEELYVTPRCCDEEESAPSDLYNLSEFPDVFRTSFPSAGRASASLSSSRSAGRTGKLFRYLHACWCKKPRLHLTGVVDDAVSITLDIIELSIDRYRARAFK